MAISKAQILMVSLASIVAAFAVIVLLSDPSALQGSSTATITASRSFDGLHLARIRIRSTLSEEDLAQAIRPKNAELLSIAETIRLGDVQDGRGLRRLRRSVLSVLEPEVKPVDIRIDMLVIPPDNPALEEKIKRLPGTLGYTDTTDAKPLSN